MSKVVSNKDFNQLQALNLRLHVGTAYPSSPVTGQIFHRTDLAYASVWNGTVWQPVDATVLVGVIPNTALATNPLARANHTGTQVAATISDLSTTVKAYTLDTFAAPVADVSFNSHKITNLATPTLATDAAPKGYVDGAVQSAAAGIVSKQAVRVVSTTNQATISGLLTIDGITLVAGDRVLLQNQTTATQNGPYIVSSGAWTRSTNDGNNELDLGATWFVEQGTAGASTTWRLATPTNGTITPGTTSVTITQLTAGATYTASLGVKLVSNDIEADYGAGLTLSGNALILDTSVAARKFSQTIGDGTSTSIVVTHGLNTQDIIAAIRDATTFAMVDGDWAATSTTTATFTFAVAPTTSQYRVTILG